MEKKISTEHRWQQGNVTLVASRHNHDKGYLHVVGDPLNPAINVKAKDVDDLIDVLVEWKKLKRPS